MDHYYDSNRIDLFLFCLSERKKQIQARFEGFHHCEKTESNYSARFNMSGRWSLQIWQRDESELLLGLQLREVFVQVQIAVGNIFASCGFQRIHKVLEFEFVVFAKHIAVHEHPWENRLLAISYIYISNIHFTYIYIIWNNLQLCDFDFSFVFD